MGSLTGNSHVIWAIFPPRQENCTAALLLFTESQRISSIKNNWNLFHFPIVKVSTHLNLPSSSFKRVCSANTTVSLWERSHIGIVCQLKSRCQLTLLTQIQIEYYQDFFAPNCVLFSHLLFYLSSFVLNYLCL